MHSFICFVDYELFIATYGDTLISLTKIIFEKISKEQMFCIFYYVFEYLFFVLFTKKENCIISTYIFLGSHQNSLYFKNKLYFKKSKISFLQIPNKYKIIVVLVIINNYLIVHKSTLFDHPGIIQNYR